LLRARIAANESSAAASTRTIDTAMLSYQTAFPATGYPAGIANLGTGGINTPCPGASVATACIIDGQLASGNKSGYNFVVTSAGGPPRNTFNVSARPATLNSTGVKGFCSVEDNVVRFETPDAGTGANAAGCVTMAPIGQ
jgi:type IV pilus assembly protein PilA